MEMRLEWLSPHNKVGRNLRLGEGSQKEHTGSTEVRPWEGDWWGKITLGGGLVGWIGLWRWNCLRKNFKVVYFAVWDLIFLLHYSCEIFRKSVLLTNVFSVNRIFSWTCEDCWVEKWGWHKAKQTMRGVPLTLGHASSVGDGSWCRYYTSCIMDTVGKGMRKETFKRRSEN